MLGDPTVILDPVDWNRAAAPELGRTPILDWIECTCLLRSNCGNNEPINLRNMITIWEEAGLSLNPPSTRTSDQEVRPPSPCTHAPDGFTFPRSSDPRESRGALYSRPSRTPARMRRRRGTVASEAGSRSGNPHRPQARKSTHLVSFRSLWRLQKSMDQKQGP